jgi:hypothetical protein
VTSDRSDRLRDWDRLPERPDRSEEPAAAPFPSGDPDGPAAITVLASAWGDLLTIVGVCTGALLALAALGYGAPGAALPWALGLGLSWWLVAASTLIMVRQGTPGMLMAGVVFESAVAGARVPWIVIVALLLAGSLGLATVIGSPGWPLRLAAGTGLRPMRS